MKYTGQLARELGEISHFQFKLTLQRSVKSLFHGILALGRSYMMLTKFLCEYITNALFWDF